MFSMCLTPDANTFLLAQSVGALEPSSDEKTAWICVLGPGATSVCPSGSSPPKTRGRSEGVLSPRIMNPWEAILDHSKGVKPYSFDIYQHNAEGMVLIDACVPAYIATLMLTELAKLDATSTAEDNPDTPRQAA